MIGEELCQTILKQALSLSDVDEVEAYLASGAWRDKAGAYAIQEGGDRFVESIEGSHSNIVGLPMEKLAELLEVYQVVN